ncbi:MAG TPA: isocitrate lyase/phosphoenolpyruvate mutase family protein [Acidimicrobiales bacterium]
MTTFDGIAGRFLALHSGDRPLLQPNAWDAGSARILASMGFEAIATTSSGFAATLGRADGRVTRDEALAHAAALSAAVDVPVAADTENGFADDPAGVAETVSLACSTGLAGCSIEDYTGRSDDPIYDLGLAAERVAAAAEEAHAGPRQLVLTARCENHIHDRPDLGDTITRLQAYQEAGADVLFAPGVVALDEVRSIIAAVDRPLNVLALPGCPSIDELAEVGVARVSVGGAFAWVAYGGLIEAATELREAGTFGYWQQVAAARPTITAAL